MRRGNTCAIACLAALAGCQAASSGAGAGSTGSDTGLTATGSSAATTGAGATSSHGDPLPPGECIPWLQDCPDDGDSCMPWSLDADRIPDEYRCCPEVETTVPSGEPCEIQDYDGSCVDDCERGAVCILDRPDDLQGYCHVFCETSNPVQCQSDETCKSFFEMLETVPNVPVCMDRCDPLVQDCDRAAWSCLPDSPTTAGQSGFICTPPPPQEPYGQGDACLLANDCAVGLLCLTGGRVPGCTALNCCTPYCSLSEAQSGNDPCPLFDPTAVCVDWMAPDPQWSDVGVCATEV